MLSVHCWAKQNPFVLPEKHSRHTVIKLEQPLPIPLDFILELCRTFPIDSDHVSVCVIVRVSDVTLLGSDQ